jgi:hypothetical protein
METTNSQPDRLFADPSNQALALWVVFFVVNSLINGTIPFMFGRDLQSWSQSVTKFILVGFVGYALLFLVVPLILIKGWETFVKNLPPTAQSGCHSHHFHWYFGGSTQLR